MLRAHETLQGDYEDDLIACSAKRNDVDVIVTRNKRDFAKSPVPALTPEEFVSALQTRRHGIRAGGVLISC